MIPARPATETAVLLGIFATVLGAGHLGIRLTLPLSLQALEVSLAVMGAL